MEEATEITTKKPEVGAWDNMMAYPKKVKFESGTPVVVTFGKDFEKPKEIPSKDGTGVFYVFDCMSDMETRVISTSSWTLMKGLKGHLPLAGKTLVITKKNVGGKNMFFVEDAKDIKSVELEETPTNAPEAVVNSEVSSEEQFQDY